MPAEKLSDMRSRLSSRYKELKELNAIDDRSDDEIARINEIRAELDELIPVIDAAKRAEEAEQLAAEVLRGKGPKAGNRVPAPGYEPVEAADMRSIGKRFVDSEHYRNGTKFSVETLFEKRTLVTASGLPTEAVRPDLVSGIFRPDEPIGSMRQVLAGGTTTSDSIVFMREVTFTNAAAEVAEGATKAESAFTWEQATAPVQVIGTHIPVTNQVRWDAPEIENFIEGRLIDGIRRRESQQLLTGNGTGANILGINATTGIQVLDATYWTGNPTVHTTGPLQNFERVLRAKTKVRTTGAATPTFVVINPNDLEKFQSLADANNLFIGAGPFNSGLPRLWNMTVVESDFQTAGFVTVGDGSMAAVYDRMSASIQIGTVGTQFIENKYTVLAEERIALAVYRPAAFAYVTLATFA